MPSAFAAAQDMHMIALVRTFKYSSYKELRSTEGFMTNRAAPFHLSINTMDAAFNVHKAIFPSGYGRVGMGFYQFALLQLYGTKGTRLGITRR